jgi:hypothetical protein
MALTIKFNVGAGSTARGAYCKPELQTLGTFANPIDAFSKEFNKNDYVTMPRSSSPKGFISCASNPHPVEGVISDGTETE